MTFDTDSLHVSEAGKCSPAAHRAVHPGYIFHPSSSQNGLSSVSNQILHLIPYIFHSAVIVSLYADSMQIWGEWPRSLKQNTHRMSSGAASSLNYTITESFYYIRTSKKSHSTHPGPGVPHVASWNNTGLMCSLCQPLELWSTAQLTRKKEVLSEKKAR